MRRAVLLVTATALVALFVRPAGAAPEEKWARGTISAVAADTVTLTVKGQPMVFTVDKDTLVVRPGAGTKAREAETTTGEGPKITDLLKVGEHAEVRYTESGETMHAVYIRGGISAADMTSAEGSKSLEGVVSAVVGTSLTVKPGDGEPVTFVVDPKTRVTGRGLSTMSKAKEAKGEKLVLTDAVAVGDTIEVSYKTMGDVKHATSVYVVRKGT